VSHVFPVEFSCAEQIQTDDVQTQSIYISRRISSRLCDDWRMQWDFCKGLEQRLLPKCLFMRAKYAACRTKGFGVLAFFFLIISTASLVADIISADRLIDWSSAGTSIPSDSWPIYTTVQPGQSIQNAVNGCPVGQVVLLAPGTHTLTSTVTVTKGIVIRGAGTGTRTGEGLTTVNFTGSDPAFNFNSGFLGDDPPYSASMTGGYTKGSKTLTVNASQLNSDFAVGREVILDQVNDGTLVTNVGSEGACTYCSRDNGTRAMCQRAIIAGINGSTVTLDTPMYFTYSANLSPEISWYDQKSITNAGLEDLKIDNTSASTGDDYTVEFVYASYCWLRNVRTEKGPRAHVRMKGCYHCTLTDSYLTICKTSGSTSYGIEIHHTSSANLIQNNIFYLTTAPIMLGWSLSGNVFAYNFIDSVVYTPQTWLPESIALHDAHAMFNLMEGNITPDIYGDFIHGSNSHNTLFRNRIYGWQSLGPSSSDTYPIIAEMKNAYYNVAGNVLGTAGYHNNYDDIAPSTITEKAIYKLGYKSTYDYTADPNVANSMIRHGNWDTVSNAIVWDPGITDHNIPNSYYLSAKPLWFGILKWPPIDPASPGSITSVSIPAGYRFVNKTDPPPGPTPTPTPTPTVTPTPTPSTTPEPPEGLKVRGLP